MTGRIIKAFAPVLYRLCRAFAAAGLVAVLAFSAYATEQPAQQADSGTVQATGTKRIVPVQINRNGRLSVHMADGGTVADLLAAAEIVLDAQDRVEPSLEHPVQENDIITITSKETIVTQIKEVEIPNETLTIPTSLLAPGKERVLVEGQVGLQTATYQQRVLDGHKLEEELLEEQIIREPVDEKVLVGVASHPISSFDFGYDLDENGDPTEYLDVLRGQRAAGYSARAGALTASGREAVVGHVAVNPNIIPYGSKLYIKTPDNRFVYGYAVAADTGTALTQGIIAVDLFYGSYLESALNEIKYVDIYILEYN